MEMHQIRAFLCVAEEQHFGRAAARLHVTQPAVSQALRALEREVGARLLSRAQRRVALTPAGEFFRERAERAMGELERAAAEARRAGAGEIGRLRLAFTTVSALGPVPAAIAEMRRRYPDVQISAASLGTREQIEAIRSGRCDIGFTVKADSSPGLSVEVVTDEPLLAILPARHRLAARRSVRWQELSGEPVILMSRAAEPSLHALYERLCAESGRPPAVAFEVDHADTMLSFVAAGLGISHAPAAIRALAPEGVAFVPLLPRVRAGIAAMWDPASASPATRHFLSVLRASRGRSSASGESARDDRAEMR